MLEGRPQLRCGAKCCQPPFSPHLICGGMRGVISGAMLMALHTMGFKDTFDAVYGASAGGCVCVNT
eukprot:1094279-Pelagomonas_calceolata.AAC.3